MAKTTPEEIAFIQKLTDEGLSARAIAELATRDLGRRFSRGSIIGLWHRRKVIPGVDQKARHYRSPTFIPVAKPRRKAAEGGSRSTRPIAATVVPPPTIDDLMIPAEQRRSFMQLSVHTCRWPVGDPGDADFFYCGAEPVEGKPYCAAHLHRSINHERVVRFRKEQAPVVFLAAAE